MKAVFIDFDGVLNTIGQQRLYKGVGGMVLDDDKLAIFKRLTDITDAKVVLSTSWKIYWHHSLFECDEIGVEIHKKFSRHGIEIYDKIPLGSIFNRAKHIKKWLEDMSVTSFVVIDDLDLSADFPENFVRTSELVGITEENVTGAIEILNRE